LILQTGKNEQARKSYLNDYYNRTHKHNLSAMYANNKLKNFINHIRVNIINKVIAKADAKIKERELLSFKAELAREHKDISDYTDKEVNLILSDKREKIIAKIKDKSLIGLLITLLIGI